LPVAVDELTPGAPSEKALLARKPLPYGRGMTLGIQCFDFDCLDPHQVAKFWQAALDWRMTYQSDEECVLEPPEGSPQDGVSPDLLFLKVPEVKTVKNRLHLDLRPDDRDAEVRRLLDLGATRVDIGQGDTRWVVLADPEGNEFCVLPPLVDES
jgi:hypothetical protein